MTVKDYLKDRLDTCNLCQPYKCIKDGKEVEEEEFIDHECVVEYGYFEDVVYIK